MTSLGQNLDGYLALRRSLGHDLADAGRLLPRFVSYLDDRGVTTITTVVALEWALLPVGVAPTTIWSRRMTAVRGFARYMTGIDPATQVPPVGLVPDGNRHSFTLPLILNGFLLRRTTRLFLRSGGQQSKQCSGFWP
jgi:integrase/recombinase XerD